MTPLPSILAAVCDRFVVLPEEVTNCKREARVTMPRHVVCYIGRLEGHSTMAIGRFIDRDHSSVIHGAKRIKQDIQLYPHIARAVADVRERLENGDE